jgi:hypothetical protein
VLVVFSRGGVPEGIPLTLLALEKGAELTDRIHFGGAAGVAGEIEMFAAAANEMTWVFIELGAAVIGLAILARLAHRLGGPILARFTEPRQRPQMVPTELPTQE